MGLLDKIRQEASSPTVKVPPRSDLLAPQQEAAERVMDLADTSGEETLVPSSEQVQPSEILSLEAELATYPTVSAKKVGVRLEEEILEELQDLCRKNDITVETLLESFYVNCKSNDTLMRRVIKEAQSRIRRRTKAGNIRSIITKSKNIKVQNYW